MSRQKQPIACPIPGGLTLIEAASLPETFFTVWSNLFDRAHLKAGESLLVHGGSGGIGVTAIQIAKALGVTVFATAGSEEKCRACLDLGADAAIQYREEDFVERIKELTQGKGVNVILDMVGGDYINRNLKSLALEGRLVTIAFSAGHKADISIAPIMIKRLTWTGSTLRPQSDEAKAFNRRISEEEHLAAHRKRNHPAGNLQDLPHQRGRTGPSAHGEFRAYRENPAYRLV